MTSTTVMPVRSRSLRVAGRRDHHHRDQDENDPLHAQPPPSKRPRINPPPSRRRASSPDLLDTIIDHHPRLATTRPTNKTKTWKTSDGPPLRPLPPASTTSKPINNNRALYLHAGRESPDPLDTISPSLAPPALPKTSSDAGPPSARRSRRPPAPPPAPAESAKTDALPTPTRSARQQANTSTEKLSQDSTKSVTTTDPAAAPESEPSKPVPKQRRSLRSNDAGSRARSELAWYFPNYDELLSFEPPKTEFLSARTAIQLVDDLSSPLVPSSESVSDTPFGNPLVKLHNCEKITLPDANTNEVSEKKISSDEDPLTEDVYFRAHRRHERQEKQLRNIERDKAQHEKQQLERLHDELQGHEWLRVMGIPSSTDADKKLYEPKRAYFLRQINALLQKFKMWREEERRRKLERDKPSLRQEHTNTTITTTTHSMSEEDATPPKSHLSRSRSRLSLSADLDDTTPSTALSDVPPSSSEPPDANDVDAWAARQLHQEARSATTGSAAPVSSQSTKRKKTPHKASNPEQQQQPPRAPSPPPDPNRPFTSFFKKPDEREKAMTEPFGKGKKRLAFGREVPDMLEGEFALPGDILTPEAIDKCRRKRRRVNRASRGSNA